MKKVYDALQSYAGWASDSLNSALRRFETEETILLVGAPRSGTTWAMGLLSLLPGYKPLFEPLNSQYPLAHLLDTGPRPIVQGSGSGSSLKRYIRWSLRGNTLGLHNGLAYSPKGIGDHLTARHLVVKSVRLQRSLAWILNNVDIRGAIVLVRHPGAVVASQVRTGVRGSRARSDRYPVSAIKRDVLAFDVPEALREKVRGIDTDVGALALAWAVDYRLALEARQASTVKYEDLLTGQEEVYPLFEAVGCPTPASLEDWVSESSPTSFRGDETSSKERLRGWIRALEPEERSRIEEVVGWFGFDDVSPDSIEYGLPSPPARTGLDGIT